MGSKAVKERERAQRLRKRRARATKRRQKNSARNTHSRVTFPQPRRKMSEVISHLAEPLVEEYGDTPEDIQRIISLTIAAWNLTLLPPETHEQEFRTLANKLFGKSRWGVPLRASQEQVELFRDICGLIASRKQQFYPNVNHYIIDVRFEPEKDDVYFEVMYALGPDA